MANYCTYEMKITGERENIDKLISYLKSDYHYSDNVLRECEADRHFFRVFEATEMKLERTKNASTVYGGCAWSVSACMFSGDDSYYDKMKNNTKGEFRGTNMIEATKDLDLTVEIFSEESGCGFMEHYIVNKGVIEVEDCVQFFEYYDETIDEFIKKGGIEWDYCI